MNFMMKGQLIVIGILVIMFNCPSLLYHDEVFASGKEIKTKELSLPLNVDGSFKTYMSYKTITDKDSKQYQMQQNAWTNDDGFRIYNDCFMVAVGTFYAEECGKKLIITLENGTCINVITGDIKQDIHTDKNNQYVETNGNIVEFIVDKNKLNDLTRKMGDVSYSGLEGSIIKIEEVLED